jgi:hypothetical protein
MRLRNRARATGVRRVVGGSVGGFDYLVTDDATWTSTFALGAATLSGKTIGVVGNNFTRRTVTGDFSGNGGVTVRGVDTNSELPAGVLFSGVVRGVTFESLKISRTPSTTSGWWSPVAVSTSGFIFYDDTTVSDVWFDSVIFDGGLNPELAGGLITSVTALQLTNINGGGVRNCTFNRVFTGCYFKGCQNVIFENNTIVAPIADFIALSNGTQDLDGLTIRNNHFYGRAAGLRYHADVIQFQPDNTVATSVKNVDISGNTMSVGNGPWIAQPDATLVYLVKTSSFTVTTADAFAELQCNPGGGVMTITLPAASDGLYQYFFRQTGTGTINFVMNGADTWQGGAAPSLTAAGQYRTFISNGVSNWTKQREGASWTQEKIIVTTSMTIPTYWQGKSICIDASAGNITLVMPEGMTTTSDFVVTRFDNSANTVTLTRAGADTFTIRGGTVATLPFAPGYSVDISGVAGAWTIIENPVTAQIVFGNAPVGGGVYENIKVHGNIFFGLSGDGFRVETDIAGAKIFNNTFLPWLSDDMNGDGAIDRTEGNIGSTLGIQCRGATAVSFRNFTTGQVTTVNGGTNLENISLNNSDNVGLETPLSTYFNGATRSAYRPFLRQDIINAALAKTAGALDGTFIGACGTSNSNGYYNFASGVVNTPALPAPAIAGSDPIDGGTTSQDSDIVLTMNQFCSAGVGNVTIRNVTDNVDHEVFDVATGAGSAGGTVTFDGLTITINPNSAMTAGKAFALRVSAGAVIGHYDKPMPAISNDTTLNWTTTSAPGSFPIVVVNGDRLNRAASLTGVSGTRQRIVLAWHGYRTGGATLGNIVILDASRDFAISQNSAGELRVTAGTSSFRIPAGGATADNETHLLTIDLSAASLSAGVKFYRNGTDIDPATFTSVVWNTGTDLTFVSAVSNTLFNNAGATAEWQGRIGMLYFDLPGSLVDIDDPAVRARFTPAQINSDGSGPSGTAPLIYMSGNAAYWNAPTNSGTGGAFTRTGEFADANSPVIVGIFGQSQPEHFLANNTSMTGTIAKATSVPSGVVTTYLQAGTDDEVASGQGAPYRVDVTQATVTAGQVNPAIAAGTVWLSRVLPGRRFVIADFCVPGTGRDGLWDDTNLDRSWADFEAVLNLVRSEQGDINLLLECWQGNDHSAAKTMRLETFPFYTGRRFGGGAFTLGTANPDAVVLTGDIDHILWDVDVANSSFGRGVFRKDITKWGAIGWPSFGVGDTVAEQQSFTTNSTGGAISGYGATLDAPARQEIDLFMADPRVSPFAFGQHFSSHLCDMAGGTHPSKLTADGLVLHGWAYIQGIAKFAGLNITTPTIVATEGPTDGSFVDVLIALPNGGTLSTLSGVLGRSAPTPLPPHYQDVIGFEIERGSARRPVYRNDSGGSYPDQFKGTVTIQSAAETHGTHGRVGRVRITPLQPFVFGNTVHFLRGDASAVLFEPRDVTAKVWERFPLEHVPAWFFSGDTFPMPGVAVRPQVVSLPTYASPPAFTPRAAYFDGGDYFNSTGISQPATTNGLVSVWFRNNDSSWNATAGRTIIQLRVGSTNVLQLLTTSAGRLTVRLNNDTATDTVAVHSAPGAVLFAVNTWYHLMVGWSATGATIWVNNQQVGTFTWTSLDFAGQTITQIGVGAAAGGTTPWIGDIGHLYCNLNATLDLSVLENRQRFAVAGAPVTLNADGSLPTGSSPQYYYDGIAPTWDNKGTAGNVSLIGTLTASASPPSY